MEVCGWGDGHLPLQLRLYDTCPGNMKKGIDTEVVVVVVAEVPARSNYSSSACAGSNGYTE